MAISDYQDLYEKQLEHYGTPRHSGRYPWGSGEEPFQSSKGFKATVNELRKNGLTDGEIANAMGYKTLTAFRQANSVATSEIRAAKVAQAEYLRFEKQMSLSAIADRMGLPNESSVRSLLDPAISARQTVLSNTVKNLREELDKNEFIQIGKGVENHMGIARDKLMTAVSQLEAEGYNRYWVNQEQLGIKGNFTTVLVLARPGDKSEQFPRLQNDPTKIAIPGFFFEEGAEIPRKIQKPVSVDPKSLQVIYDKDGGSTRDGLIELRRGVPELDMGNSTYAQVRILVDGTHYLKGMAVVRDDLPPGVNIRFNSNKDDTGNKLDALKEIESDPNNPFGSAIQQQKYHTDKDGDSQLTALNLVNDEGSWDDWSRTLSSQMLSKQPVQLAERQLKLLRDVRQSQLDDINALTNPTLKQKMLEDFSEKLDSDAVDLKALALPRTANKVLIPVPEMKDTEVYAPHLQHGEQVVLIRHPHGGKFEIPSLTVNNKVSAAKQILGTTPRDAIAIAPSVAEQLSGADFDGDSVLVIPNNDGRVKHQRVLKQLENFNPRTKYKGYEGMKVMANTQTEMGMISNLITDMQVQGAPLDEVARAVKHSMVVIDAEKHKLNYKQSYIDNGIETLKKKWQTGGASTLISRASSEQRVPDRKARSVTEGGPIDLETGELKWTTKPGFEVTKTNKRTGETTTETVYKKILSTKMRETSDARSLMSNQPTGTPIERVYADHANELKAMANRARLEMVNTHPIKKNPSAAKAYSAEVASLKAKVDVAQKNAPLERQAQILASARVKARVEANPSLENDSARLRKVRNQELQDARAYTGAHKERVNITPREWEAIQAGAFAHTPLLEVLNNANPEQIKEYATPRAMQDLSGPRASRARGMAARGYTQAEIAELLGVSSSTVAKLLKS